MVPTDGSIGMEPAPKSVGKLPSAMTPQKMKPFPQDRQAAASAVVSAVSSARPAAAADHHQPVGSSNNNDDQFILTSYPSKDRSRVRLRPTASAFDGFQLNSRLRLSVPPPSTQQLVQQQQKQKQQQYSNLPSAYPSTVSIDSSRRASIISPTSTSVSSASSCFSSPTISTPGLYSPPPSSLGTHSITSNHQYFTPIKTTQTAGVTPRSGPTPSTVATTPSQGRHLPSVTPTSTSSRSASSRSTGIAVPSQDSKTSRSAPASTAAAAAPVVVPGTPRSPPPQNLKGDPHRQAKVKTELCLYYIKNLDCPFGERCNYAHGWGELRFKRLKELEKNGLIPNATTYRTHPCLSWVTTGSCPFGQRCTSIHDPRVTGPTNSWMPFADAPVAHLKTTVNVDRFYHRFHGSLHAPNPLVGQVYWEKCRPSSMKRKCRIKRSPRSKDDSKAQEWQDTYDLVCNLDTSYHPPGSAAHHRPLSKKSSSSSAGGGSSSTIKKHISEEQRLSMVLIMSYGGDRPTTTDSSTGLDDCGISRHADYIFAPSHLVYNELCMVLQTRYFRLLYSDASKKSEQGRGTELTSVREIDSDEYEASRTPWDKRCPYSPQTVIVAREIAFGPVGEGGVSVWFDIPPSDVVSCTPQMVKKYKRARNKQQQGGSPGGKRKDATFPPLPFHVNVVESSAAESFHSVSHQPFFHMNAINDDSWHLARRILFHRIRVLKCSGLYGYSSASKALLNEERALQEKFWNLKKGMDKWSWPRAAGREKIDEETRIPECDALYCLPVQQPSVGERGDEHRTQLKDGYVAPLWESFVNTIQEDVEDVPTQEVGLNSVAVDDDLGSIGCTSRSKLSIFRELSQGSSACSSTSRMPHINDRYTPDDANLAGSSQDRGLWKQMLLDTNEAHRDDEGGSGSVNEWDLVKEHYLTDGSKDDSSPSSSSLGTSPSSSRSGGNRGQALPLSATGEKRETIWSKLNGGAH